MKTIFPMIFFMLLATLACSLLVPAASIAVPIVSLTPQQADMTLPSPTLETHPQCVVSASSLNMRACAGTHCTAKTWLHEGDVLTILSTQSQWIQVITQNNVTGWVHSKFCASGE